MTDDVKSEKKSIQDVIAGILERWSNNYFGEDKSPTLSMGQRHLFTLAGIFVFGILMLAMSRETTFSLDAVLRRVDFILESVRFFPLDRVNPVMFVVLTAFAIAMILSQIVSNSIRRGTPLLFFFVGFFLSAFLISFVSGI